MPRLLPVLLLLVIGQGGCTSATEPMPQGPEPTSRKEAAGCVPPKTIKRDGMRLKGYCPRSDPEPDGAARLTLGAITRGPCWSPPDFDGSFWALASGGGHALHRVAHGGFTGQMKLQARDAAQFEAPAQRMRMTPDGPFMRVPERGKLLLRFRRLPAGIRSAGCA